MGKIFYFTGTGNSLDVAKKISNALNLDLISISEAIKKKEIYKDEIIIFVTPVYHGDIPNIVKRFIEQINILSTSSVYTILTLAALEGKAMYHINKILKNRGLNFVYGAKIQLPDNYLFSTTSQKKREILFKNYPRKLEKIIDDIKSNKNNSSKYNKKYSTFSTNLSKKTFNFLFNANKKTIDYEKCTNCGICAKVCPVNNIVLSNEKFIINNECENCMACAQWCPQKAVYFGKKNATGNRFYTNPNITIKDIINQKTTKNNFN